MIGPSVPAHLLKHHENDDDQGPQPSTSTSISVAVAGPQLPPYTTPSTAEDDDDGSWMPELPPDLAPPPPRMIGPSIPSRPLPASAGTEDDSDDDYGPMPLPAGAQANDDAGSGIREFIEREERREKELQVRPLLLICSHTFHPLLSHEYSISSQLL